SWTASPGRTTTVAECCGGGGRQEGISTIFRQRRSVRTTTPAVQFGRIPRTPLPKRYGDSPPALAAARWVSWSAIGLILGRISVVHACPGAQEATSTSVFPPSGCVGRGRRCSAGRRPRCER